MHRMTPILALLLFTGCYPGHRDVTPEPVASDAIEQAAFDACREYSRELAGVAKSTAEAAGTFKSHADAVDFGASRNKSARDESFKHVYELIDAELDPEHKPYDADATAKVFRSFAKGAERAAK